MVCWLASLFILPHVHCNESGVILFLRPKKVTLVIMLEVRHYGLTYCTKEKSFCFGLSLFNKYIPCCHACVLLEITDGVKMLVRTKK